MAPVPIADVVITGLSMLAGLVMMGMVLYFRWQKPDVVNTPSFHLSLWIGLAVVLNGIFFILRSNHEFLDDVLLQNYALVRVMFWSKFVFTLWFAFLIACIAIDLQLSFIHRKADLQRIQRFYAPVSLAAAVIITIPALAKGIMRWDSQRHFFNDNWSNSERILFEIFGFDLWLVLAIIYSLGVVVAVVVKVRRELRHTKENPGYNEEVLRNEWLLYQFVLFVALYPMVLVITQPAAIVTVWLYIGGKGYIPYFAFSRRAASVLVAFQGILSLAVFLLNPSLKRALYGDAASPFQGAKPMASGSERTEHNLPSAPHPQPDYPSNEYAYRQDQYGNMPHAYSDSYEQPQQPSGYPAHPAAMKGWQAGSGMEAMRGAPVPPRHMEESTQWTRD
ncbi:uncharacterized protein VTP21DRAFT_9382 [Calcarisporiella thermophila]|uniref:uncharacterized protein n=1 Tax=Calcarisporiella thermophila TaxID=911321 RepID=UPI003742C718